MQTKTILTILATIAAIGFVAVSNLTIPALATAPQKPSDHPGYNGLDKADTSIHNGPGLFSKPDVEFHTGTGQGGFCVSNVCPPR